MNGNRSRRSKSALTSSASPEKPVHNGRIRAPKLPHIVAQRLRAQIANGELKPGDTLPSEAELLLQFGISRPTLREALRVLEAETLIELGRGSRSGAIILAPSIDMAAQYGSLYLATHDTTLGQIHEIRTLLEPPLASLHAKRAKRETLRALERCVKTQRDALKQKNYVTAATAVNDFHSLLVKHSGNTPLRLVAGMLHAISVQVYPQLPQANSRMDHKTVWRRSEKSTDAHGALLELIKGRKPAEAETFWRDYMLNTAAWLRRSGLANLQVQVEANV